MKDKIININRQIKSMYAMTVFEALTIAGASWVALLAARGFSLVEIGVLEGIFHAVSICGEMPSGVVADVLGRKKTMVASRIVAIISTLLMIFSRDFATVALAIGVNALSYNLASGTREALAYDSLKKANQEEKYVKYTSTEMALYRISDATATLCAGVALILGYKIAYTIDLISELISLAMAFSLTEVKADNSEEGNSRSIRESFKDVVVSSIDFLRKDRKYTTIIIVESIVAAVSTLLLFFLQAKLPEIGLPKQYLGIALFVMSLGAAVGAKAVEKLSGMKFKLVILVSSVATILSAATLITGNAYIVILGGFLGAFFCDFLCVRTDIVLNEMIPSEQRATLISVCSFTFSIVMIVMSPLMGWVLSLI